MHQPASRTTSSAPPSRKRPHHYVLGQVTTPSPNRQSQAPASPTTTSVVHGSRPASAQPPPLTFEGPVGMVRCVSPQDVELIVDRLYRQGLEEKKRHLQLAALESSLERPTPACPQKEGEDPCGRGRPASAALVLTTDEVKESVQRLYYGGVRHKLESHKKLAEKFLFQPRIARTSDLRAAELRDHVVNRFYTEERDRQKKRHDALHATYVAKTEPNMLRLNRDAIGSIVDRLFKGSA